MSLKSSNNIETNKYELVVEVGAEEFEAALEKAYMRARKNISIPGFRKGKASRKMVEKLYGDNVFFEDAVNLLLPEELQKAADEAGLVIVDRPEFKEVNDISKETGVTFTVICTVKPEAEVSEYRGLEIERTVKEITDEDVDNSIQQMREKNARIITVDDRAAQNGDDVVIDFEGFIDGVAFDGGKAEGFTLSLGSGQFIPGFEEQVCGHNIDEEFDINVTFPEEYSMEELAGKAAVFKIKLHEIKTKELPELDDAFVKDTTEDFETVDELKADTRKKLEESAAKKADADFDNALFEKVIANTTVEIPAAMIESKVDEMVHDFEHRLSHQGLNLEMYCQYTGMTVESFRQGFYPQAESQVKVRLAMEKIAKLENIEVTPEMCTAEIDKLSERYNMPVNEVIQYVDMEDLKLDIAVSKAAEIVRSTAVAK